MSIDTYDTFVQRMRCLTLANRWIWATSALLLFHVKMDNTQTKQNKKKASTMYIIGYDVCVWSTHLPIQCKDNQRNWWFNVRMNNNNNTICQTSIIIPSRTEICKNECCQLYYIFYWRLSFLGVGKKNLQCIDICRVQFVSI